MKLFYLILLTGFFTNVALADQIQPVLLSLTCLDANADMKVEIISDAKGSITTINDDISYGRRHMLAAATEGRAPTVQHTITTSSGGGAQIDITITGHDLESAFLDNSIKLADGRAQATVAIYDGASPQGRKYETSCRGVIVF